MKEKSTDCTECGEVFQTRKEQSYHMKIIHDVAQESKIKFICSECDITFPNNTILINHIGSGHIEVAGSIIDDNNVIRTEECVEKHNKLNTTSHTEDKEVFICDICETIFPQELLLTKHYETNHNDDYERINKSEYFKMEETGGKKEKDPRPGMEAFENDNLNNEPTGINMKGKGLEFQDACIALKHQMVKGRIFRDKKGRTLTILEAPKGTLPIDVEVTTHSKKPTEKRGKAKLIIHKPNMKKGVTIQASLYSGSSFVFVKVLMEMFVKTFIESLISEPDEDPMDQYRVKPKEKNTGKNNSKSKEEKCEECDRTFPTSHGLNIHIGKAHKKNDSIVKRKRNEEVIIVMQLLDTRNNMIGI